MSSIVPVVFLHRVQSQYRLDDVSTLERISGPALENLVIDQIFGLINDKDQPFSRLDLDSASAPRVRKVLVSAENLKAS
jgi:hypothetical protein